MHLNIFFHFTSVLSSSHLTSLPGGEWATKPLNRRDAAKTKGMAILQLSELNGKKPVALTDLFDAEAPFNDWAYDAKQTGQL